MKVPMEGLPVCEHCRLKPVRHELRRHGIVVNFCDDCYWGLVEEKESPGSEELVGEAPTAKRKGV